jgi:hypothetical protein
LVPRFKISLRHDLAGPTDADSIHGEVYRVVFASAASAVALRGAAHWPRDAATIFATLTSAQDLESAIVQTSVFVMAGAAGSFEDTFTSGNGRASYFVESTADAIETQIMQTKLGLRIV